MPDDHAAGINSLGLLRDLNRRRAAATLEDDDDIMLVSAALCSVSSGGNQSEGQESLRQQVVRMMANPCCSRLNGGEGELDGGELLTVLLLAGRRH